MLKPVVRFLHSADLHLDSPLKGLSNLPKAIYDDLSRSTINAFHKMVDVAINEKVDFVLIIGDLFDQESSSIKSSLELKKGLERLNSNFIKAYISFGNHDYMMQQKAKLNFPENTFVFPSNGVINTTYEKDGRVLAEISGFSYQQRAVIENMVEQYQKTTEAPYHIATLHGSLKTNQEHDTYAPFLLEDLKSVNADYWALGHIHKREILHQQPLVVYSGNIQGRHMKESGEKGCYLVELNGQEPHMSFHQLHDVLFSEEEVAIENVKSPEDIVNKLEQFKGTLRKEKHKTIVRLTVHLSGSDDLSIGPDFVDEVLEIVNETEEEENTWIWINEMRLMKHQQYDREELKESNPFINEILKTIDQTEELDAYIDELQLHPLFKKYTNIEMNDLKDEIKQEAEDIILRNLMKEG
ncbi:metallophosphoesterase family protein [Piscibacillus halophilus]|uniref:DNA repair exonuclease SbcCD nuclease subunit n=1 Tax=Piscibacillus halophilus TaxID=571933 RepID=A0A1H9ATX6_9BACI|nr:DNA repair exonuclease [Piscibacillus halophilus]SEP80170.1 DNA repair exonuclease SbcCD nuclease subunit [Piscibacillus halophilus]